MAAWRNIWEHLPTIRFCRSISVLGETGPAAFFFYRVARETPVRLKGFSQMNVFHVACGGLHVVCDLAGRLRWRARARDSGLTFTGCVARLRRFARKHLTKAEVELKCSSWSSDRDDDYFFKPALPSHPIPSTPPLAPCTPVPTKERLLGLTRTPLTATSFLYPPCSLCYLRPALGVTL